MAKITSARSFISRLVDAVRGGLLLAGIDATVTTQPVPGTKLYRVFAASPAFKKLQHSERQGLVWRIIDSSLPPDERFRISMIRTLTPDEMSGK